MAGAEPADQASIRPVTVSVLTAQIKEVLETGIPPVWIEGEISNLTYASSGHVYLTLKDSSAQINCAAWRSAVRNFPVRLENGMKLLAFGSVQVYAPRGNYQLIIEQIIPAGQGMLQLRFEELKRKLAAEGLFDTERKNALPLYPMRIGIITSPTGAAIEDMSRVLSERWPMAEIILAGVRVQGEGAAAEIAKAIGAFNRDCGVDSEESKRVDVLIVGRGGGSLEDLWAFNEEIVVRAVAASEIPIVSAVGHEIDFALSDFAADVRAPTPTAAAVLITPDAGELLDWLEQQRDKMSAALTRRIKNEKHRLEMLMKRSGFRRPIDRLMMMSQRVDELDRRIDRAFRSTLERVGLRLAVLNSRMQTAHPARLLDRGYAIVTLAGGSVIRSISQAKPGDQLSIQVADGNIPAVVTQESMA